jgi:hypothetical protein
MKVSKIDPEIAKKYKDFKDDKLDTSVHAIYNEIMRKERGEPKKTTKKPKGRKIVIEPLVIRRLEFIMENCKKSNGAKIESFDSAIRYALIKADLLKLKHTEGDEEEED